MWPRYGFVGLIVLVWRSVEVAYWNISLEDDFSDLDPKAFYRASTVAVVDFYASEVPLDKEWDSSSFALPVFLKQPVSIHHNPSHVNCPTIFQLFLWITLLLMKPLVPGTTTWDTSFNLGCCLLWFMWTEPARTFCFFLLPAAKFYWTFQTLKRHFKQKHIYEQIKYQQWILKSLAEFCLLAPIINIYRGFFESMYLKPSSFTLESQLCTITY